MTIRSTQSPPPRTVQQLVFLFLLTSPTSALLIGSAAIESKWTAAMTMEMALPHVEASIARILWLERGGVVPNTKERKEENKQNNDEIITNGATTKETTTTMDDCGSTSCCSENDASWLIPLALECDQHVFDEHLTHNAYVGEDDKEESDNDDVVVIGNPSWQSLQVLGSRIGHHHHHHHRNGKENDDLDNNNNDDDDKSLALVAAWTLLALGGLESAIRTQMSYPTGQAPLLSTMISQLQQRQQHHNNNNNNTWNGKQNQYHHDDNNNNNDNNNDDKLIPILQSLLLPNNKKGGLNLKNLLWHGFCGSLPRPWLALVISLTRQVQQQQQQQQSSSSQQQQQTLSNNDNNNNQSRPPPTTTTTDPKRRKDDNPSMSQEESQWEYMESFQKEIALGETLRQQQQDNNLSSSSSSSSSSTTSTLLLQRISMWLPSSHLSMLELAISWMDHYPACTSALLIVMLEHGLRLEWCHVNHQFIDAMAQPGRYYVTLDGHGQRHQHDLLLHPYRQQQEQQQQSQQQEVQQQQQEWNNSPGSCSNVQKDHDDDDVDEDNKKKKKKTIKNSLVNHLGPNVMSFLADLFCSAAGPNIRATLGHGLWDSFIHRELELMAAAATTMTTTKKTTDYDAHSTPCPNTTTTNNVSLPLPKQPKQPDHCRFLQPVVSLLVLALYETATAALSSSGKLSSSSSLSSFFHYTPKFSFAAMTYQSLGSIRQELRQLQEILERYHCCCYQTGPSSSETRYRNSNQPSDCSDSIVERRLSCPSLEQVEHLCEQLMKTLEWNKLSQQQQQNCNDQIYAAMEHELVMNQKLASMGAIRTLLDDIAQACQLFNTHAQDALQLILAQQQQQQQEVNDDDISYCSLHETTKEDENVYSYSRRRQIKKANRILSLATPLAWTLYKFTAHVAMVALLETLQQQSSTDNDKTTNDRTMIIFLKAVERTRMVVSTTTTFFIVNMDRSIKAMNEYSKSKAIQKFRQVCCSYYSDEQNI